MNYKPAISHNSSPINILLTPTSPVLKLSASTKFMEWTNDDALELIEQYRSHTELWNRADPKYKDKLCRFRAWSEIAERFGCSKAEVERKMNVLLTQYRREKHKMLVKLYQGIQPNPSKWYAFKRFDFMEAGGGSSANLLAASSGILQPNATSSPPVSIIGTNGHQHVSAAANFNGLTPNFGDPSRLGINHNGTSSQHRRIKSKELKYFGAMGLNLPMLLASSQTLDSWSNPGSHFSPPARSAERSSIATSTHTTTQSGGTLHLQLPTMSAFPSTTATTSNNLQELSVGSRSLFGGSSNNSEPNASPHKTMDISEEINRDDEATAAEKADRLHTPIAEQTTANSSHTPLREVTGLSGGGGGEANIITSPIPNQINTNEAHLHHTHNITSSSLRQIAAHNAHPPYKTSRQSNERDELEIKQELVDYFHPHAAVNASVPAVESQRSYSSADEMRTCAEDYAQDLRVAAAKGMNFGSFVLPRNLRPPRSSSPTESLEEKYTPLNMRKLNTQHSGANVLINSLLSNESMSEDLSHNTPTTSGRLQRTASQDNSSAAAAAALYAESLVNRDDCDFVGSNVTLKLRAMDRTQRIIAEKLISEVLFYGQFNELERSARIQPK